MIYQISSGQGPSECELGVAKFLIYLRENYNITVLETSPGRHPYTYRSVRLYVEEDLSEYEGSIQWVCPSYYRPTHKRKNWFLDFSRCPVSQVTKFDPNQVVFDTFRSGGKGGQNVNKVESGVRAIYLPTGHAVTCTEERSQYANKRKATERLIGIIQEEIARQKASEKDANWQCHNRLERGNASVKFVGFDFVKQ